MTVDIRSDTSQYDAEARWGNILHWDMSM